SYNAANQVTETVNAQKAAQTINFGALSTKTFGDAEVGVSATATSTLAVGFSASGQCTVSGNTVHITGAGSCTVTASQAGDSNYSAATPVDQSFTINKAAATVSLSNLTHTYDGSAKSATATTNPSGKTVVISYSQNSQPVASPTNAGSYDVSATINDANYQGSTNGTLTIGKASSTTAVTVSNATFDSGPHGGSATATGAGGLNQSVTVNYTGRNATVYGPSTTAPTGAGDYTAAATFNGDANHNGSSDSKDFQIAKAATTTALASSANPSASGQSVTFTATVSSAGGTPAGAVQFNSDGASLGAAV